MKINIITFIIIVFSLIGGFAEIRDVTVFADRALVTRSLKQNGIIGENKAVFKNLPLNIDQDTLRAKGFVTAGSGLKILDIKIVKNYEQKISDQEKSALLAGITGKKERIEVIKYEIDRINQQKKILEIFNVKLTNETKEDIENGKLNVKQWQDAVKYYETEYARFGSENFKLNREMTQIKSELIALEDQYKKYQTNNSYFTLDAFVAYSLKKEGNVDILLSYMAPGTYWYPVYDCRLDMNTKVITMEYHAKVKQNTGEDWNNVNLTLSTARPDLSGIIPVINPWEIDISEYEYKKKTSKSVDEDRALKDYSSLKKEEQPKTEEKSDKQEEYSSEIKSQGLALSYNIPQKVIIPSGSEETKITVSTGINLVPDLSWAIVPRRNNTSFMKGKIKNTSEFTFLPGEMNVYVDESMIGKSAIDLINPSQEFELSLGRDPRITAEFVLDDVNKGIKFGNKFEQRRYKITLSNNSKEDIVINVKDVIPKSLQQKKLTVKIIKIEPQPDKIDNESICNWNIKIAKNSKVIITEEWYLEYAENQYIQGLD